MSTSAPSYDDETLQVHLAQSARAFPGPDYYIVLHWVHQYLRPERYLEIGVRSGESLRAALPETKCLGIDPEPQVGATTDSRLQICRMTSDDFFAHHSLQEVWQSPTFDLAFIDGLHLFEQTLQDFMNLERTATRKSLILLHDCIPLDAVTCARDRTTHFYSGDVWKAVHCLRRMRPDLKLTIVRTAPTGLCLVGNLNPASEVMSSAYEEIKRKYLPLMFGDYLALRHEMPAMIDNTPEAVRSCLEALAQDVASAGAPVP
ncbi:MAG: class I SAM-dependent methyltransferase [Terriglobales bacterium]|jgi:predicted O-methyltransferase YrrM